MQKIWDLFKEFHALLDGDVDLKTCQECHALAAVLLAHAEGRHEHKLREWKDDLDFFADADTSVPFSFGQCGDRVYWKIVDGVLYIGGEGPMWQFDNLSVSFSHIDIYSPWRRSDFHTVIIHDGVTTIGEDAFHGAILSGIVIPRSVKTIEEAAFFDAKIEKLILPETIDTLEAGIVTGFSRVVDTLVVSANIPHIKPFSLFNRDDQLAKTVILTGALPDDLGPLVESRVFDDAGDCEIRYPEAWDTAERSFIDWLTAYFPDADDTFRGKLKSAVTSYRVE